MDKDKLNTLSSRLLHALDLSGLKQNDLAKTCGTSRAAVSKWFSGQTETLRGDNLVNVARALGVAPEWLSSGKGEMRAGNSPDYDLSDKEFLDIVDRKMRNVSPEARKKLAKALGIYVKADEEDRRTLRTEYLEPLFSDVQKKLELEQAFSTFACTTFTFCAACAFMIAGFLCAKFRAGDISDVIFLLIIGTGTVITKATTIFVMALSILGGIGFVYYFVVAVIGYILVDWGWKATWAGCLRFW